jgi:hypothetical protein
MSQSCLLPIYTDAVDNGYSYCYDSGPYSYEYGSNYDAPPTYAAPSARSMPDRRSCPVR